MKCFLCLIVLLLPNGHAFGQGSLETVRRFQNQAKAQADALRARQSAKVRSYQQQSQLRFQQLRRQLADQYKHRPPLQDYARTDRPRVTTMEETIQQKNEELLQLRIDTEENRRHEWEVSEERRLKDFTTQEQIRAREHAERKTMYLQAEAEYWNRMRELDVQVWSDTTIFHDVNHCPLARGPQQKYSHEVKNTHERCPLCQPTTARINPALLPRRMDDPGEYVAGRFHPVPFTSTPATKARLEKPHKFSFGEAEYLERIRCARKYDVYLAVINKEGLYELAWYPANKMERDDLLYIGRMNLERRREREAMEEKIKETPNP